MSNTVWTAELDNRYRCSVTRNGDYKGILTIVDSLSSKPDTLLTKDVELAFNAQFGPDAYDVAYWQELCAATVDKHNESEEQ